MPLEAAGRRPGRPAGALLSRGRSGSDRSTARGTSQVRPPGPSPRRPRRTRSDRGGRTTVTIEASTAGSSKAAPQSITTSGPPAAKIKSRRGAKSRLLQMARRHDEAAGRLRFGHRQTPFQEDGRQVPVPPGRGERVVIEAAQARSIVPVRTPRYGGLPITTLNLPPSSSSVLPTRASPQSQVLIQAGKRCRPFPDLRFPLVWQGRIEPQAGLGQLRGPRIQIDAVEATLHHALLQERPDHGGVAQKPLDPRGDETRPPPAGSIRSPWPGRARGNPVTFPRSRRRSRAAVRSPPNGGKLAVHHRTDGVRDDLRTMGSGV